MEHVYGVLSQVNFNIKHSKQTFPVAMFENIITGPEIHFGAKCPEQHTVSMELKKTHD